ncbi:PEP-CTERM sorting domain-containing protein, partial [Roseateles sp. BYS78W]
RRQGPLSVAPLARISMRAARRALIGPWRRAFAAYSRSVNRPYDNVTTRYYSDRALNVDHINHAWASPYAGDASVPAGVHIAFEDLKGGGDFNYADQGIVVRQVLAVPAAVPEPASWALLMGGAAGLAVLRRRRAR